MMATGHMLADFIRSQAIAAPVVTTMTVKQAIWNHLGVPAAP